MKKKDTFEALVLIGIVFIVFLNLLLFGLLFIALALNNIWYYSIMGILLLVLSLILRIELDKLMKKLKNANNKKNR